MIYDWNTGWTSWVSISLFTFSALMLILHLDIFFPVFLNEHQVSDYSSSRHLHAHSSSTLMAAPNLNLGFVQTASCVYSLICLIKSSVSAWSHTGNQLLSRFESKHCRKKQPAKQLTYVISNQVSFH